MKYNVCRYFDDVFEKVIETFDNAKFSAQIIGGVL